MTTFLPHIEALVFDADDTLWDCQSHFEAVETRYCALLSSYASEQEVRQALFEVEMGNMDELGYGCKAFTLSMVENAVRLSRGRVTGAEVDEILRMGRSLLRLAATPLPGVETTLQRLRAEGRWRLAVFTKGELLDQERKLERSGLRPYFDLVQVVSDKTEAHYAALCRALDVLPERLCMVGNSLRSDVLPALAVGCAAVHIPFATTWAHEEAEPVEHLRLVTLPSMADLPSVLL